MNNFKEDIEGIFQECEESLIWYLWEYNLNPEEMKKIFIDYASKWFNTIAKEKKEFDKENE